jgi:hypothetical protein
MRAMLPRTVDVILAVFVVGALASLAAPGCSSESDVNATCTPNVTKDGIRNVPNGCDGFAVCAANPKDPTACCSPPPSDETVAECLYGYGVGAPVGSGGSGTGGSTSTSGGTAGASAGGGGGTGGKGTAGGGGGT